MIHATEESRLHQRDCASRVVAVFVFWLVPCVGGVAISLLATCAIDARHCMCGHPDAIEMAASLAICPSTLTALPFAISLTFLPPIAARSAGRLYVAVGSLGIATTFLAVVLAVVVINELDAGEGALLFVPIVLGGTFPILSLALLVHCGWLARHATGTCPLCGYDMAHCSGPRCPECGWPATPESRAVS